MLFIVVVVAFIAIVVVVAVVVYCCCLLLLLFIVVVVAFIAIVVVAVVVYCCCYCCLLLLLLFSYLFSVNSYNSFFSFKAHSLKDLPGSVVSASNQLVQPVSEITSNIVGRLLLPPKMVAAYVLSSKPIQCFIPNVVVFEEISRIDIEMDELVGDSDEDSDQTMEEGDDVDKNNEE